MPQYKYACATYYMYYNYLSFQFINPLIIDQWWFSSNSQKKKHKFKLKEIVLNPTGKQNIAKWTMSFPLLTNKNNPTLGGKLV